MYARLFSCSFVLGVWLLSELGSSSLGFQLLRSVQRHHRHSAKQSDCANDAVWKRSCQSRKEEQVLARQLQSSSDSEFSLFDGTFENEASNKSEVEFELHASITSIAADEWNACLTEQSSPFLLHSWLRCLEESKCAAPETGWAPQHVSIKIDGHVQGFVPLYIKAHSQGEFIFDQTFADAAYSNNIDYYPKLLVGIPFTPATGHRILWSPEIYTKYDRLKRAKLNRSVGEFLKQVAHGNKLSSVHFNFLTDDEATDLAGELNTLNSQQRPSDIKDQVKSMLQRLHVKDDFLRRTSLQYHWTNTNPKNDGKPFESFDDYLSCFKSKRRINIRRERRTVLDDQNIRIDAVTGQDILKYDGLVERMFEIYLSTIDKMIWGRQYLTVDFFKMLARSDFVNNLVFMCARHRSTGETLRAKDVFAGTFNIVSDNVFYGRYWGQLQGHKVNNLHFEACYWTAIEFCILKGLKRMEPGAGGGDYKWARGFDPALIHSVHYICNPGLRRAVSQFLDFETENNVELSEYLRKKSVIAYEVAT